MHSSTVTHLPDLLNGFEAKISFEYEKHLKQCLVSEPPVTECCVIITIGMDKTESRAFTRVLSLVDK